MPNQPTKPKGKPRGRCGGRKPLTIPTVRKNVYLTQIDWTYLKSLAASPSQAIRRLIQEQTKEIKMDTNKPQIKKLIAEWRRRATEYNRDSTSNQDEDAITAKALLYAANELEIILDKWNDIYQNLETDDIALNIQLRHLNG